MTHDFEALRASTTNMREAVGVFSNSDALESAVDQLQEAGFDASSMSVLGTDQEVKARIGRLYQKVAEIEDDERAPRARFVSAATRRSGEVASLFVPLYVGGLVGAAAVVATGGALAIAIAATALGSATGATLGGLLAEAVANHHAERIEEQIRRGGLVLWVRVPDPDAEKRALAILEEAGAQHLHVHELQTAPESDPRTSPEAKGNPQPDGRS